MKLPPPREPLAGCIWLARIIEKARLLQAGELPAEYESRFCHPSGVDGQFLRFFNLTRQDVEAIALRSNDDVAAWFVSRPDGANERIERWNDIAVNLGRSGYPMAERFCVAVSTTYRDVYQPGMTTVFEVLEADEGIQV